MVKGFRILKGSRKGKYFDIALYDIETEELIFICSTVKELTIWMLEKDPSDAEVRRVSKRVWKAIHIGTRIVVKRIKYDVKLIPQER